MDVFKKLAIAEDQRLVACVEGSRREEEGRATRKHS